MGDSTRLLSIFFAVALLAFGVAACGEGDSDSGGGDAVSPTTQSASEEGSQGEPSPGTASERNTASGGAAKDGGKSADAQKGETGGSGASDFVPKEHEDSGGGSAQLRVKGGDNSVQEFGEEADDSERADAATVLHNFLDARAAEDWESACSFLSRGMRKSLEELVSQSRQAENAGCPEILEKLTNRAVLPVLRDEAAQADVGSLRIEGDSAFIIYRGLNDDILGVPMANEDGTWKVASIAGTPLN